MTEQEIEDRITTLEGKLENPDTFPTEVYTRIVGYYRAVHNFNEGRAEEYKHRVTYDATPEQVEKALSKVVEKTANKKAVSYLLFTQDRCPNCPPLKKKAETLTIPGVSYDCATEDGFTYATIWNVTSTPTLILLDENHNELERVLSHTSFDKLEKYL